MDTSLRLFVIELGRIVLAALAPVILVAFLSIPSSLGGHSEGTPHSEAPIAQHMT